MRVIEGSREFPFGAICDSCGARFDGKVRLAKSASLNEGLMGWRGLGFDERVAPFGQSSFADHVCKEMRYYY